MIRFGRLNVVVGLNNAGKTTVAEALRLVSIATERFRNMNVFREPPAWLIAPKHLAGCNLSLDNLEIHFDSLFHRYGDPPAMIDASFGSAGRIRLYIGGPRRVHCVIYDGTGGIIRSRDRARKSKIPTVATLPQVGPVLPVERVLMPDYVRGALSSRLAPIHFRNQINLLHDLFPDFQETVQRTWPGLQVQELVGRGGNPGRELHLEVRDGDFVAEVGLMGHGLQMWLQTIWFLTRTSNATTTVFDEPDVYMHADLQRKLIRYVRNRYPQVILTTHSTEIMSEVAPEDIIVIDKARGQSASADSLPAVQRVVASFGSAHNLHLARLWNAKKFLIVEGKDVALLKVFQDTIAPMSPYPLDGIPNASIGGWGNWRLALGSSLALENAAGKHIRTYCLLDSDFHTPEQVSELQGQFHSRNVELHIWTLKELENYLLVPAVICRAIIDRLPRRGTPPIVEEIDKLLQAAAVEMQEELMDGVAQEFLSVDRALGVAGANRRARAFIAAKSGQCGLVGCVSGKALLSKICAWAQAEFGVSLSSSYLAQRFHPDEIHGEIRNVLSAIEDNAPLPRC